jgi:hypothetical protein
LPICDCRLRNCGYQLIILKCQLSIDRYSLAIHHYTSSRTKKDPVAWWELVATGQVHRGSESDNQSA